MSAKKPTPKTQGKGKSIVFIERYREIEIYLNLLTKPFLSTIFPTTAVGTSHIFDKVENEIKTFIESKLEELTGLSGTDSGLSFSVDEIGALKLVASTILSKENVAGKSGITNVKFGQSVSGNREPEPSSVSESDDTSTKQTDQSFESEEVIVSKVAGQSQEQEEPVRKTPQDKKPPKIVAPTEVPEVTFGTPTDTMKRARPKGVKPLPQPTSEQMAQLASAQAEAAQSALLSAQMNQAAHLLPDNLGMPNLDFPTFR
jgi:hypothetical protein